MSENTNSAGMSQLQRLKALQEENKAKASNLLNKFLKKDKVEEEK